MNTSIRRLAIATLSLALAGPALADGPTAFELVKRGNQYVGVQSRNKVVEIHSDKSVASLVPNIWYVIYFDPDTTFKCVQVKFGAGKEMGVSHPWRMFQMSNDRHEPFDKAKLKVDSDQALKTATSQPLLKHLTLKTTQCWLQHSDTGPRWKIRIWAAKLRHPNATANVGDVYISAADGKVVRTDLHPDRVE